MDGDGIILTGIVALAVGRGGQNHSDRSGEIKRQPR